MSKQIFFSVGEPSGDQHAARLITQMAAIQPQIHTCGFGGQAMRQAGCQLHLDLTQHAVVGLLEVLPKLREFFRFADQAESVFQTGNIDAVVLVDFPGFNWHIAKRAKRYGIPVFYYCPPQLWAWGGWRVRKMRRTVDHVLAVLPIEERYFGDHGIPTTYVGHPFFDAVQEQVLDNDVTDQLEAQIHSGKQIVAVLPGSRSHEVKRNWPLMLAAIRQLSKKHPDVTFAVACYRQRQYQWCRESLTADDSQLPIEFFVDKTSEIIDAAHCAMMVSGSVSLEMMARQTPAAVIYRVGRLLYAFGKCVIGVDSMTLPNLMGPTKVFPEKVSVGDRKPTVDFLIHTVDAMLSDTFYYHRTCAQLANLAQQHASGGATQRAAQWICDRVLPSLGGSALGQISRRAA
ncbi:MAG: lipid-A-disaccharide synthase [Pirellulaceae bacterium]|nr:lipid-A-disaccharide synthase [Pirellulaceae bacterium]